MARRCLEAGTRKYKHASDTLGCSMTFTIYYPPAAEKSKVPVNSNLSLLKLSCGSMHISLTAIFWYAFLYLCPPCLNFVASTRLTFSL